MLMYTIYFNNDPVTSFETLDVAAAYLRQLTKHLQHLTCPPDLYKIVPEDSTELSTRQTVEKKEKNAFVNKLYTGGATKKCAKTKKTGC